MSKGEDLTGKDLVLENIKHVNHSVTCRLVGMSGPANVPPPNSLKLIMGNRHALSRLLQCKAESVLVGEVFQRSDEME